MREIMREQELIVYRDFENGEILNISNPTRITDDN